MPPRKIQARRRHDRRSIWFLGVWLTVSVITGGCATEQPGPILAPLGQYETEVGVPWQLPLTLLDPGAGQPTWHLLSGPEGMRLFLTPTVHLTWLATAFDLALVGPGRPRTPGPTQAFKIKVCDRVQQCVTAAGTVRAIPSPQP
ncbi:MAG: hypothetical protein KC502_06350 [Myxococcales bacterium]|nr:hypothetical protein [Myxococcales bacterium]